MSVPPNVANRLSQASIQSRQSLANPVPGAHDAPGEVGHVPGPQLGRQWDRSFVNKEKLVPTTTFASLFQRIQPTAKQIGDYMHTGLNNADESHAVSQPELLAESHPPEGQQVPEGEKRVSHKYADLFTFTTNEKGELQIKLKPTENSTGKKFKLENSNEAKAYESFRTELQDERAIANQGKSALSRLWSSIKDSVSRGVKLEFNRQYADPAGSEIPAQAQALLANPKAPVSADIPAGEGANVPPEEAQAQDTVPAQNAADRFRNVKMTVSTTDMSAEVKQNLKGHEIDNSAKAEFKDTSRGWKIAAGVLAAGVLIGAGIVFGPVLIPLLTAVGGIAIAGGVIGGTVALGVIGKALSYIKAPWWGSTLQGKIEKKERKDAIDLGDSYAQMVRQQFVTDHDSRHGVQAPEGGWAKPSVLETGKLKDFMAIAAKNSPADLKAAIKAHLLNPETSHLDPSTIANAKRTTFFSGWFFTGNAKGHAQKTVDMVANQIALGIMRGVGEGVMQLMANALSDELSRRGHRATEDMFNPTQAAFTSAVSSLLPEGKNFELQDTKQILARMANYKTESEQASAGLEREINKGEDCLFGLTNATHFKQQLERLNGALSLQKASLDQVSALVGSKALGLEGSNPTGSLGDVNERLPELLAADKSPEQIQALKQELKDHLTELRAKINSSDVTAALIEAHANALMDTIDKMDKAIDDVAGYATALKEAETAFTSLNPSQALIQQHIETLKGFDRDSRDLNPLGVEGLDYAFMGTQERRDRLDKGIAHIEQAFNSQQSFSDLLKEGVATSKVEGGFALALSEPTAAKVQQAIDSQTLHLREWGALGFSRPADWPSAETQAQTWRSSVAGTALGLSHEQQNRCSKVLSKLGDLGNTGLIEQLKGTAPDKLSEVLSGLEVLQSQEGNPAQHALDGYMLADQKLGVGKPPVAAPLMQALAADHSELILKHQLLMKIHQNLSQAATAELGGKLYQWADIEVPPEALKTQEFLGLLEKFTLQGPGGDSATTRALSNLAAIPSEGELHLDNVAKRAEQLNSIGRDELTLIEAFTNTLTDKFKNQLEQAIDQKNQRAQAAAIALKQQIVGEAAGGVSQASVQAVVADAASLKDANSIAEYKQLTQDLLEGLRTRKDVQVEQKDAQMQIERDAEMLKALTGFSGSTDALMKKVMDNAELRRELSIVLNLFHQVRASDASPGKLEHSFSPEALAESAKRLAAYESLSDSALDDVTPATKQRLENRNKYLNIFKNLEGKKLTDELKSKNSKNYITDFAYEQRAHQALIANGPDDVINMSDQEKRILIENTATDQANVERKHTMFRNELLSDAKLEVMRQALQQSYQPRLDAIQSLIGKTDSQGLFNAANSDYLVTQLEALQNKIPTTQELRDAYNNAQRGGLVKVGKLFMEADIAKTMNKDAIEGAYQRGMYEASSENLKWFDPKKFSASRPGFVGRFIFKLLGRDKRLPRMLQTKDVTAINRAVQNIAKKGIQNTQLIQQNKLLNTSVLELQTRRKALLKDTAKLEAAYKLLAIEQLELKLNTNPILTDQDMAAIDSRWHALFPDAQVGRDYFEANERPVQAGASLATIEQTFDAKLAEKVSTELADIGLKQQQLRELHQTLKQAIDNLPDSKGAQWYTNRSSVARAMGQMGFSSVDMDTITPLRTSGFQDKEILEMITPWKQARDMINKDKNSTQALLIGRQAKHELVEQIKQYHLEGLTSKEIALQDFLDLQEEHLLDALPPPGAQTLTKLTSDEIAEFGAKGGLDETFDAGKVDDSENFNAFIDSSDSKKSKSKAQKPQNQMQQSQVKPEKAKTGSGGIFGLFRKNK